MTNEDEKTAKIRALNDRFRKGERGSTGQYVFTKGIQRLIADDDATLLGKLVRSVTEFDEFEKDNDPYAEHDFGAFDFEGERVFWKMDYYSLDMTHGAEDPSDEVNTLRVITIMLAAEY